MASNTTPAVYQTNYTTRHDNYARIVNVSSSSGGGNWPPKISDLLKIETPPPKNCSFCGLAYVRAPHFCPMQKLTSKVNENISLNLINEHRNLQIEEAFKRNLESLVNSYSPKDDWKDLLQPKPLGNLPSLEMQSNLSTPVRDLEANHTPESRSHSTSMSLSSLGHYLQKPKCFLPLLALAIVVTVIAVQSSKK